MRITISDYDHILAVSNIIIYSTIIHNYMVRLQRTMAIMVMIKLFNIIPM